MILPSIVLTADLFADSSGNDVNITPLGLNFIEEGKYPRLTGGRCFVADISTPTMENFTVEYRGLPESTSGTGCLVASSDYRVGMVGQFSVYLQVGGIYVYTAGTEELLQLASYSIPTNKRNKVIDVTIVKRGGIFTVYLDGNQVIQLNFPTTIVSNGYALLGEISADGSSGVRGFSGTVHHLRVHHGIALPPELFELMGEQMTRSAALSKLTSYISDPRDLGGKIVRKVGITDQALIIQFNTGEMLAVLRKSIGLPGVLIADIDVRGANADQVWVTLTNGQEIQAGVQAFFESELTDNFPSGFGYLINDNGVQKYIPINVYGDAVLSNKQYEVVLSTLATTPLAYDEAKAIVLEERYFNGQVIQHTGSAGVWVTKPYYITAGAEANYTVSAAGNVILPVGVYRIVGTHVGQIIRSLARLFNVTAGVGLVTSTPAMATNNLPTKFFDVGLTVVSPTEISIQSLSEASQTASSMVAKLLSAATVMSTIKIYRIE